MPVMTNEKVNAKAQRQGCSWRYNSFGSKVIPPYGEDDSIGVDDVFLQRKPNGGRPALPCSIGVQTRWLR